LFVSQSDKDDDGGTQDNVVSGIATFVAEGDTKHMVWSIAPVVGTAPKVCWEESSQGILLQHKGLLSKSSPVVSIFTAGRYMNIY